MAMFGKKWAEIGAGLKDIGIGLQGGQSDYLGGYREDQRQLQARDARTAAAKALADKLLARSQPRQTGMAGGNVGLGVFQNPQLGEQEDALSLEAVLPDLLAAQAAGVDISPYASILRSQPKEQVLNAGDGVLATYTPGKGIAYSQAPNPNSALERELLQAQIAAARAQAEQREQQGAYYGARARQPYAPRPGRSSSNKHPPLPAGFRIVQ